MEAKDILTPPRIPSLGRITVRVIQHATDNTIQKEIPNVYPMETIYNLKQRITLLNPSEKTKWYPNQLFVAQKQGNTFRPLEFQWPFTDTLPNPLQEKLGKPDARLYEHGNRLPVEATLLSGITVENALFEDSTIHVWNLATIVHELSKPVTEPVMEGFLKLYFPTLKDLSEKDASDYEIYQQYREYLDSRMERLDAYLGKTTNQVHLVELYRLKFHFPKKDPFASGILERKFYELEPSETIPFVRFFPSSDRQPPLVKLAMNKAGVSTIKDKKLLDYMMADEPIKEMGSVIVVKSPVYHSQAPVGTVWTLRIYEDGSAELYIGAPRKDQPLSSSVYVEAVRTLPDFLKNTPWQDEKVTLSELSALYEVRVNEGGKPSRTELYKRYDTFSPLFLEEKAIEGAAISMRYKAVSNFVKERDPVMNFITTLFLRDASLSMDNIPVQTYVTRIAKEFGIPPSESATILQTWIERKADFVVVDPEKEKPLAVQQMGVAIHVLNSHPQYRFVVHAVESELDWKRILSLLTVFVSFPSEELGLGTSPKPEKTEKTEKTEKPNKPTTEAPAPEEPGDYEFGFEMDEQAENAQVQPEAELPKPVAEQEVLPPVSEEWFLKRLKEKEPELVSHGYSSKCQANAGKQPHVMDLVSYRRVRRLYKDSVFWLEAPLSSHDLFLLQFASTAVGERRKKSDSETELLEWEREALRMGISLRENKSITQYFTRPEDAVKRAEMEELIREQQSKPLWTVVRAGTMETPSYFMCAEYWCLRDDLPLISSELFGTVSRTTPEPKVMESCSFCGGKIIADLSSPKIGETVMRRKTDNAGMMNKYAGYQKKVKHADKFIYPCCFTDQKHLDVPVDGRPLPPKQRILDEEPVHEEPPPPPNIPPVEVVDINRDRPFSSKNRASSAQNQWYIPNQNILGRGIDRFSYLAKGMVSVPPTFVNELLGQNPETFLTKTKGYGATSINSYLTTPAQAFLQYGLGNSKTNPGENLLSLLAFAKYATDCLVQSPDNVAIQSNTEILNEIFVEKETSMVHAFEQANYGTLVHEFGITNNKEDGEFATWYGKIAGTQKASQRAYYVHLYNAWRNFENYVRDTTQPKELRLWESLFSCPGLLTHTGFVLVIIKLQKEEATIECPSFGISFRDQETRPPLLFVIQDDVTGLYDPFVIYDGVSKEKKHVVGVIQKDTDVFGKLSKPLRTPLQAFITQYFHEERGCGKSTPPVHPWMPIRESTTIPMLGDLYKRFDEKTVNGVFKGLLRDRSNRLVGCILANTEGEKLYIPVLDDGTILPDMPSLYDETEMPSPSLHTVLEFLFGNRTTSSRILTHSSNFPGLAPRRLIGDGTNFIALDLKCGATIRIEPVSMSINLEHRKFSELSRYREAKTDMPWDTDKEVLGSSNEQTAERTSEEILDESFQHLRISISNWLNDTAEGKRVKSQIELLRQARIRLPLYELQKRLDLLLAPVVYKFLTTKGDSKQTILRRDCIQITRPGMCVGGCTWADGSCKIHTSPTERYEDPIRVLTSRLTDELLRTFGAAMEILSKHVSHLKPLTKDSISKSDDSLLFSAYGRGSESLYDKLGYTRRRAGEYARGLTYPEEVSIDTEEEEWSLKPALFGADIQRDARSRLVASIVELSGKSIQEVEAEIGRTVKGIREDWVLLANMWNVDIIRTRNIQRHVQPVDLISVRKEPRKFVVLDPTGIPYVLKREEQNVYILSFEDLPTRIQEWLTRPASRKSSEKGTPDHTSGQSSPDQGPPDENDESNDSDDNEDPNTSRKGFPRVDTSYGPKAIGAVNRMEKGYDSNVQMKLNRKFTEEKIQWLSKRAKEGSQDAIDKLQTYKTILNEFDKRYSERL